MSYPKSGRFEPGLKMDTTKLLELVGKLSAFGSLDEAGNVAEGSKI
jgi:hypothetical protein